MDAKIWELYALAKKIIAKVCKNKCYHYGERKIDSCNDYIERRLESNDFQVFKDYDVNHEKKASASTYLHMIISQRLIDFLKSAKERYEIPFQNFRGSNEGNEISSDEISDILENDGEYDSPDSINPEEDGFHDEDGILSDVVSELSYSEQLLLQYRYDKELSYKEIGSCMNMEHKHASKKIENIQKKLKRKLEKLGYTLEDIL